MVVEGGIYSFNFDVSVYLFADDVQRVQARTAVAVASATGKTNGSGRFVVTLEVPASAATGSYTLQVNGYSLLATVRSVNVGVAIEPLPWIKAKMSNRPGRAPNVTVQGLTGEIPAGTEVVPMIRYKGKSTWVKGASVTVVGKDGTFTWK